MFNIFLWRKITKIYYLEMSKTFQCCFKGSEVLFQVKLRACKDGDSRFTTVPLNLYLINGTSKGYPCKSSIEEHMKLRLISLSVDIFCEQLLY